MIIKKKQLNNNPKMKNLKFLTCKKHDALTWKNPWIDIKLHYLKFQTQVGPKEKPNKTK
jgi:hypothetical protein